MCANGSPLCLPESARWRSSARPLAAPTWSRSTATGAKDAAIQVARLRTTLLVGQLRCLQHPQPSASSGFPPYAARLPGGGDGAMARCGGGVSCLRTRGLVRLPGSRDMCGRPRPRKRNVDADGSHGRVQTCVRPVRRGARAAGRDAIRGCGPKQSRALKAPSRDRGVRILGHDRCSISSSSPPRSGWRGSPEPAYAMPHHAGTAAAGAGAGAGELR